MYKIILEKEDFLNYQLFTASKSKQIKKKRILTWLIFTALMLSLGFVMLQRTEKFLAYYFLIFGVVTLVFYPYYQRIQYKKHFLKHIDENYKNRIGKESELGFEGGYIISSAEASEGKIKLSEIEIINETANNLFIKLHSGDSLIVPVRLSNYKDFKSELTAVTESLDVKWNIELDWKWK